MIVQCEKCQTRFRLDDAKVTAKGVKVRCAKCKHVFAVHKPLEDEQEMTIVTAQSDRGFGESYTPGVDDTIGFGAEPQSDQESHAFNDSDSIFPIVATQAASLEASTFDASAISFDTDDELHDQTEMLDADATSVASGEVDFSSFDFGDAEDAGETTTVSSLSMDDFSDVSATPQISAPAKEIPQGLDFSDDDMFGAVVESAPAESPHDAITFDIGEDSFAESMDVRTDTSSKGSSMFSLDAPGDTPFSLGEIDFGDELTSVAVQQVNPDDLKPSQEILFAPLAAAQASTVVDPVLASSLTESTLGGEELPPLSITSRRKQSPLFTGLIAVVAVLVVATLGYFGYSSFGTPKDTAPAETGKISIKKIKAVFVDNDDAGELLIVSGEALNEFPMPRAALQVKVTVFDGSNQSVATKSAYGGNPLTEEQLGTLSLEKIEAAMANQFGDSLANMEVAPGKVIPFVVVLANLPKNAKDFTVQSAGSTVATGKQQ
jgi:predicted Zn finger-like uncharacterized protein